jgi:AbrB family looped-hinge helix DNA binding protein
MKTRISTKGQVVLPSRIRRQLDLRPGDSLDAKVEGGNVVLAPPKKRRQKAKIVMDRRTGLPVLTLGPGAPILTSKEIDEMLADFP